MKRYIAAACVAFSILLLISKPGFCRELPKGWFTDWAKATEAAKEKKLPIFLVFSAKWCSPCQAMVKNVFPTESVTSELKNWVPVYLDIDLKSNQEIAKKFEGTELPTLLFLDAEAQELNRTVGEISDPNQLVKLLRTRGGVKWQEPDAKLKKDMKRFQDWFDIRVKNSSLKQAVALVDKSLSLYKTRRDYEAICIVFTEQAIKAAQYPEALKGMQSYQEKFPTGVYREKFNQLMPQVQNFLKLAKNITFD